MHIIVTGASSFLGRAAVKVLREHGHEVTPFRHSFNEEPPETVPAAADIWLHFAWAGVGSAGRSDPGVQQYNLEMSLDAMSKAIEMGCRKFIFAGSQAEYGHAQDGSCKLEDGPVDPVSAYGQAKLMFSRYAAGMAEQNNASPECKRPLRYVHLRIFSVYGPGDHDHSLIPTLLGRIRAGEAMDLGPCSQQWNYLYIDDAAEAIALMCEKFTSGTYNIGSRDIRPLREYVEEAARIAAGYSEEQDLSGLLHFGARADNAEGPADLSPDVTKLELTGFQPRVSFAEGIRRTLAAEETGE